MRTLVGADQAPRWGKAGYACVWTASRAPLWLLLVSLLVFDGTSYADPIAVDDYDSGSSLNGRMEILEDVEQQWSFEQVMSDELPWQLNPSPTFSQGYTSSQWWLRIATVNNSNEPLSRLLNIGNSVLDVLEVSIVRNDVRTDTILLGDQQPFSLRPVAHRDFIIPLTWQPGEQLTLYFRVNTSSSMSVPIAIWEEVDFSSVDSAATFFDGIYMGTLLAIALYNLLIFAALREAVYLHYVGYVLSMLLFTSTLSGYAFRYLWPDFPGWNNIAITFFLSGIVIFGGTFTRIFLNLKHHGKQFDLVIYFIVGVGTFLLISSFVLPYFINILIAIPFAVISIILGFYTGLYAHLRGEPSARFYLIAWTAMLFGGLILAAGRFNLLAPNLATGYALQIGASLEMVLLSFALAERINVERRLRDEAQALALEAQRRTTETLEQRVQERTHELQELNQQLQQISDTDELTGLHNRRFLESLLENEWNRCMRYQHPLCIMLIDLDHFKSVNDIYGHLVGDECLREIAIRLRKAMRWPSDQVTRFGGEEFCVVLPETDIAGAHVVAERIRLSIEEEPVCVQEITLNVTTSIGLVVAIPNQESFNLQSMISAADEALYKSKADGRNRTTVAPLAA